LASVLPATLAVLALLASFTLAADTARARIEADWLLQEKYHTNQVRIGTGTPTFADAMGGCDGIKHGGPGFHTSKTTDPWWQVDLGESQPVARVLIWNRCDSDATVAQATNLVVRLSDDAQTWATAYTHDGTPFRGQSDKKPLEVKLSETRARFVRIQLAGERVLHLDEVEVFGPTEPEKNLALNRPADQCSVSEWSRDHRPPPEPDWRTRTAEILAHSERLLRELRETESDREGAARTSARGTSKRARPLTSALSSIETQLTSLKSQLTSLPADESAQPLYLAARRLQRRLTLAHPILDDFDTILFTKRVPGSYSHMSDQYYGWWSRPGGGIFLLRNFRGEAPVTECLTASFTEPGSFLRPSLSYDGKKVLFAWCKHYPHLAVEKDKLNKANVPEDAFYHVFEMNLDGSGVRQLTRGKYDDFDARYLPDGRIVFLSTRRGQAVQVGRASARATLERPDLPDCYVRCGGGEWRPVAVYTLHTMNADGGDLNAISPFEMFEWEPSIAHDGSILHARWDYIDRDNMPFMSLWSINPDGTNPRLVYKNYTSAPHCAFEPQCIPGSRKIVFTASGHHSHTMGSLVLLDPAAGTEGKNPITRLTPEVPFPEIEAWPITYYTSPWPLSERFYLVAWGDEGAASHALRGHKQGGRWEGSQRPPNAMGLYFFDAAGNMEMLYRDPDITSVYPLPVRARPTPPALANAVKSDSPPEGRFLLSDVYRGLKTVKRGDIQALRVVAVPPKTHPVMNFPELGVTRDDPGKCVLGTVPVEADGSAYFRAPAGVIVFFQALDAQGRAVQTMRSATHVQPGQTVSCLGCHKDREQAPPQRTALAALRAPSKITVGPEGSWPLRFDRLVQPVLDRQCGSCHHAKASDEKAAKLDLTPAKAYDSLVRFGKPSLHDVVMAGYRRGTSVEGEGPALGSALLALLDAPASHYDVKLTADDRERLITWMDTYAQKTGSFSPEQENELERLRRRCAELLEERGSKQASADLAR
jgi:hypothetical protein